MDKKTDRRDVDDLVDVNTGSVSNSNSGSYDKMMIKAVVAAELMVVGTDIGGHITFSLCDHLLPYSSKRWCRCHIFFSGPSSSSLFCSLFWCQKNEQVVIGYNTCFFPAFNVPQGDPLSLSRSDFED